MDYPLLPADIDKLLLYTGIMISFAFEKMVRTRGEPQKMPFLGTQSQKPQNQGIWKKISFHWRKRLVRLLNG